MPKRKITILAIFSIIVFCSIINFLPNVHAINYTTSDAENDVLRGCDPEDTGDYYDEIDIVNFIVTGRNINCTVVGSFADWDDNHYGTVSFSSGIQVSSHNGLVTNLPTYVVEWENNSGPIEATLEKHYSLGGGNYGHDVWNGTGWEDESTATAANIVVDVTNHSVISYIPDAVEEIPSNMKVICKTHLWIYSPTICAFSDVTPLPSSDAGGIPSYNLFILICTMIGVSLLIIKKYKK
ncbi:MAG: hypothetical protein KAX18_00445 [Candidatus Lokiarchaeota archaeon]|nr:hypothetical protein [Candidatus Lokiarchaeota archaeon]